MAELAPRQAKYESVVAALQSRIANGTYPPGSLLPSESQLIAEFDISRQTAVRVYELLKLQGWIEAQAGKGRFARGVPAPIRDTPDRAGALLVDEVTGQVRVLDVARRAAPSRALAVLDLEPGAAVVIRRWLTAVDGVGPVELVAAYVPAEVAAGTDIGSIEPLPGGVLRHLTDRKRLSFVRATERTSARPATVEEAALLEVEPDACLLSLLLAAHERSGRAVVALDVVIPPTRLVLEDEYPLTL